MRALLPLALAAVVTGCATPYKPVPDDYKGPVVVLADTGAAEGGTRGRFFAAVDIDGNRIENALDATRSASRSQAFSLTPVFASRQIPVRSMNVCIVGTHQTAAPIHALAARAAGTFFSVQGVVAFTPVEGKRYEVTGELTKERSCVWIADAETRQPASERVCTT